MPCPASRFSSTRFLDTHTLYSAICNCTICVNFIHLRGSCYFQFAFCSVFTSLFCPSETLGTCVSEPCTVRVKRTLFLYHLQEASCLYNSTPLYYAIHTTLLSGQTWYLCVCRLMRCCSMQSLLSTTCCCTMTQPRWMSD